MSEPVAWMDKNDLTIIRKTKEWVDDIPLYTTPQDQLDRIAELEKLCKDLALTNESLMKL